MSSFLNKNLVLDRIKEHYQLKNNAKLALFLGIPPTTLSSWYSRNTLDLDVVYEKCVGIDWHWLLTGHDSMLHDNKNTESVTTEDVPNTVPASPSEDSIIYKMYQDQLRIAQKEREENKGLLKQIGTLEERIRQLESQNKGVSSQSKVDKATEAFTSESFGDYGEGSLSTKLPAGSKKLSAGKA